jgi:arylsulfatase A-like enzyme
MSQPHAARVCLAAALLVPALCYHYSKTVARPRNLLLITLDTMRADRLPPYGFSGVATPALDKIAAEGVVYENTYAAVPLTLPSHSSLFTGMHPPTLRVRDNADPPLGAEFTTLAEVLRSHGLRTAAFIASAVLASGRGVEQGFDLYSAGAVSLCSGGPPLRRRAAEVIDDAMKWLTVDDAKPFFVWVHLFDTHRPYDLPDQYNDGGIDSYLSAIAYEDSQIARLIDHLQSRGSLEDTVIVVAGDHGESLGDHGEESHGIFLYQEALRVPLMMRAPGMAPRRVADVARLVDVMPTVLEVFGVPYSGLEGTSLLHASTLAASDSQREVYGESMYPLRFGWAPLRSLRDTQRAVGSSHHRRSDAAPTTVVRIDTDHSPRSRSRDVGSHCSSGLCGGQEGAG